MSIIVSLGNQPPPLSFQVPLYTGFRNPLPPKSQIFHTVSYLAPSYFLKATKFFRLNVSDFNYFLCKNCNRSA